MTKRQLPSPDVLRQLLDYNPETGELRWRERPISYFADGVQSAAHNQRAWNSRFAGKPALASRRADGYMRGKLFEQYVFAHRVVWKMLTGNDPECIDHIDGNPANNRQENLRSVSHKINLRNTKRRTDNTSGYTGVIKETRTARYVSIAVVDGRRNYLGSFGSPHEAAEARSQFLADHGFHQNHGR